MEKLDLRVQSSLAKCIGTIISIAGALVVTLYKGLPITSTSSPNSRQPNVLLSPKSNWVLGGCLLATGSFCLAVLFIFQVNLVYTFNSSLDELLQALYHKDLLFGFFF